MGLKSSIIILALGVCSSSCLRSEAARVFVNRTALSRAQDKENVVAALRASVASQAHVSDSTRWIKKIFRLLSGKSGSKGINKKCQKKECGESTLEIDKVAASFYNMKHHEDILVIPNEFYATIHDLAKRAPNAKNLLVAMLTQARSVYKKQYGELPEYQCVNWRRQSVKWVHIHNFNDKVQGEGLPFGPYCWCEKARTTSVDSIADKWLKLATGNSKNMRAASGKISKSFMRFKGDAKEIFYGDGKIPDSKAESCYCLYSGCKESKARFPSCR